MNFCCQHAEKMWQLTSPEAVCSSSFVGKCAICGDTEPYSYHVPEYLWRKILPENLWNEVVCGKCFHEAAQHHADLTPETQSQSQAVVNASALEQSDGDTPPAQAQVA